MNISLKILEIAKGICTEVYLDAQSSIKIGIVYLYLKNDAGGMGSLGIARNQGAENPQPDNLAAGLLKPKITHREMTEVVNPATVLIQRRLLSVTINKGKQLAGGLAWRHKFV
jgi:hypothetical protein